MIVFLQPEAYQSTCETLYLAYAEKITKILKHAQIEHIGSSAIPAAWSKGDLDIYVGVSKDQFEHSIQQIKLLNFREKKDTLASSELRMFESQANDDVAIQLVVQPSQYEFFLSFRDALRTNPELVEEYNQLKLNCQHMDMHDYRIKKSEFISAVLNNRGYKCALSDSSLNRFNSVELCKSLYYC